MQKGNYAQGQEYDEEKSIDALLVGGMVLPYQEAVRDWNEEEYGIYYLGSRTWGKWDENIFSLNIDGSVSPIDWGNASEVTGYSISVFCPNNEQVTARRYMVGYELNNPEELLAEYEPAEGIEGINDLPAPVQAPATQIYIVQKGDTLSQIARMFDCTVDDIVILNSGLIKNPDLIYPGWKLVMPQK